MSDEDQESKTEEPSQKRLDDAAGRGDVPKSQELSVFLALAAFVFALIVSGGYSARGLAFDLRGFLGNAHLVPSDGAGMTSAGIRGLYAAGKALAVPIAIVLVAAVAAGLLQHRPVWSLDPLKPKFDKISPFAGLKRILGPQAFIQFGKGLLKIGLVGTLATWVLWGERDRIESIVGLEPGPLVAMTTSIAVRLLSLMLAAYALLALGDYVLARFNWMKRQRMTKHEQKEEHKQQDGNPEIKAKLRQIRMGRLRKRMMAAVPQATVIVTNPTHYAVALRYDKGSAAPICVAKGIDQLALRIRAIATEHDVPIVENPPLARALHASVEIDGEIPVEHYRAVAEVVGYVLRLKRRAS